MSVICDRKNGNATDTKSVKLILKAASTFKGEQLINWIACVSTAAESQ